MAGVKTDELLAGLGNVVDQDYRHVTKQIAAGPPLVLMPQTTHRGVMCVWEFGAVAHEHQAWTRYLRSERDTAARRAYAESQFSGAI